jgi:hypothetical protein
MCLCTKKGGVMRLDFLPQASASISREPPDVIFTLSQNILQFALGAYAAENFTHQIFNSSQWGLSAVGQDMRLSLTNNEAKIIITMQGNFQLAAGSWKIMRTSTPIEFHIKVDFSVVDRQLFVNFRDGDIVLAGAEKIEKFLNDIVDKVTKKIFSKPLLTLPVRMDIAGRQEESTDETQLTITAIQVQHEQVTLMFQLVHDEIPLPPFLDTHSVVSHKVRYSRSRAILLVRQGIQAYTEHDTRRAVAYFVRAAVQSDPSYELAWLWLASVVEPSAERRYCLERAVAINPSNQAAYRALQVLADQSSTAPDPTIYPFQI